MNYSIAPNGIFWSWQGEGVRAGEPMAFLRLAGCSLGCEGCDTDFSVDRKLTLAEVREELDMVCPPGATRVVWVTGGEPSDLPPIRQDILVGMLKRNGWEVCVATNGEKPWLPVGCWVSLSPHGKTLTRSYGGELKVGDGLNGQALDPDRLERWEKGTSFEAYAVQPLWDAENSRACHLSLARCLDFLRLHPRWRLSMQLHKFAGVL